MLSVVLLSCKLDDNSVKGSIGSSLLPPEPSSPTPPASFSYVVPAKIYLNQGVSFSPDATETDLTYSISPTLPSGMSLNPMTGEISGTPTVSIPDREFTVTASSPSGTTQSSFSFSVDYLFTINSTDTASDGNIGDQLCDDGSGNCTLRAALEEAEWIANNIDDQTDIEIAVPAGTYQLDTGTNPGALYINSNVHIIGADQATTVIDSNFDVAVRVIANKASSKIILEELSFINFAGQPVIDGNFFSSMTLRDTTFNNNIVRAINTSSGTGPLVISDSSFINNSTSLSGSGGALYLSGGAVIRNTSFTGNQSTHANGYGGAINVSGGTLNLDGCVFTSNAGRGAKVIYGYEASLIINNSVFDSNISLSGGGPDIWIRTLPSNEVQISNSTFSNSPTYPLYLNFTPGGLGADAIIENSTFANNATYGFAMDAVATYLIKNITVFNSGAGIASTVPYSLVNSLLHGNATNCSSVKPTSLGSNIDSDGSCDLAGSGDSTVDPLLSVSGLADNGGPTETITLQSGSPAIDAGNNSYCGLTDQRGFPRPVDKGGGIICDIGAVEIQ